MAGPGNEMTVGAVGHGQMRAAHADREHAIEVLKAAFVHGRLDRDEFDLRIGRALASRTYADLAALTADITAPGVGLPAQGGRPWLPEPARKLTKNKKAFGVLVGATSVYPGLLFIPPWLIPADGSPFVIPFLLLMFVLYAAVPTGWLIVFHSWLDKRAGKQSAQRLPAHSP